MSTVSGALDAEAAVHGIVRRALRLAVASPIMILGAAGGTTLPLPPSAIGRAANSGSGSTEKRLDDAASSRPTATLSEKTAQPCVDDSELHGREMRKGHPAC